MRTGEKKSYWKVWRCYGFIVVVCWDELRSPDDLRKETQLFIATNFKLLVELG